MCYHISLYETADVKALSTAEKHSESDSCQVSYLSKLREEFPRRWELLRNGGRLVQKQVFLSTSLEVKEKILNLATWLTSVILESNIGEAGRSASTWCEVEQHVQVHLLRSLALKRWQTGGWLGGRGS